MNKKIILFASTSICINTAHAVVEKEEPAKRSDEVAAFIQRLATMPDSERQKLAEDPAQIEAIEATLAAHKDSVLEFAYLQRQQQKR